MENKEDIIEALSYSNRETRRKYLKEFGKIGAKLKPIKK